MNIDETLAGLEKDKRLKTEVHAELKRITNDKRLSTHEKFEKIREQTALCRQEGVYETRVALAELKAVEEALDAGTRQQYLRRIESLREFYSTPSPFKNQ